VVVPDRFWLLRTLRSFAHELHSIPLPEIRLPYPNVLLNRNIYPKTIFLSQHLPVRRAKKANTDAHVPAPIFLPAYLVTIGRSNDTAPDGPGSEPYRTDLLTNAPTVTGTVAAVEGLVRLEAQIDAGPLQDITGTVTGGTYVFDPGPLPPGPYRITVRATDVRGGTGQESLDFRDNHPPVADAGPARTVDQGSHVSFDASGSQDGRGPAVRPRVALPRWQHRGRAFRPTRLSRRR
jgi:hypothetical protein